jgi:hypothetical protein
MCDVSYVVNSPAQGNRPRITQWRPAGGTIVNVLKGINSPELAPVITSLRIQADAQDYVKGCKDFRQEGAK